MARPISIASVLLVSALALTACGGGSSQALSMQEYLQRADAICQQGRQRFENLGDELERSGQTANEKAHLMTEVMRGELDSLHELDPPAQRSAIESMLAMEATLIRNVENLADATESDDQAATQLALSEGRLQQQRLSGLAHQLGFRVCGGAG